MPPTVTLRQKIEWVLTNGIFALLAWVGFVQGSGNAQNVVVFFVWFNLVLVLLSHIPAIKKTIAEHIKKAVSIQTGIAYDMAIICMMAWAGAWVTAITYTIVMCLQIAFWTDVERLQKGATGNGPGTNESSH